MVASSKRRISQRKGRHGACWRPRETLPSRLMLVSVVLACVSQPVPAPQARLLWAQPVFKRLESEPEEEFQSADASGPVAQFRSLVTKPPAPAAPMACAGLYHAFECRLGWIVLVAAAPSEWTSYTFVQPVQRDTSGSLKGLLTGQV